MWIKKIQKKNSKIWLENESNKVDPALIGHPVNCEFLTAKENLAKGSRGSVTIHKLILDIEKWDGKKAKFKRTMKTID